MSDPRRWFEDGTDATPLESRLLRAARDDEPPEGAEGAVWAGLIGGLPGGGPGSGGGSGGGGAGAGGGISAGAALPGGGGIKAAVSAKVALAIASVAVTGAVVIAELRGEAPPVEPSITSVAPGAGSPEPPAAARVDRAPERAPDPPAPVEAPPARPAVAPSASRAAPVEPETPSPAMDDRPAATEIATPRAAGVAMEAPAPPVPAPAPVAVEAEPGGPRFDREIVPSYVPAPAVPAADVPGAPHTGPGPRSARDPAALTTALREESALLERARAQLVDRDPVAALATLESARRRFPRGELVQERTALVIEALHARGDHAGASRQARAFLRAYPSSPLAARVKTFLGPHR